MLQFKTQATENYHSPQLLTSLKVGKPGDKYEQEADAVAETVMRMREGDSLRMQPMEEEEEMMQPRLQLQEEEEEARAKLQTQQKPLIQMQCEECEEEELLQTKATKKNPKAENWVSDKIKSKRNTGNPLSGESRNFMENRFNYNFGSVRIHNDHDATLMSNSIGAQAFTTGNDIYFNQNKYSPGNGDGQKLLAHELTHVVQQNSGNNLVQRDLAIAPPNPDAVRMGLLSSEDVSAALHYNLDRFSNAPELQTIRDVLGLTADVSQLIDEEFVQSVASWQASHNLDIDGKLGRNTVTTLVAEYRAESHLAPSMTAGANRLAIRTRSNERSNNIDVNSHNDLFDAILSHRNAMLTLVMRIDFQFHAGATGTVATALHQRQFIRQFIGDVRRTWAEMYALVPVGRQPANYLDTYYANVTIENTNTNPHYVAHIGSTNSGYDTTDPPGPVGAGGPAANNDTGWLRLGTGDTGLFRGQARQTDALGNSRPMTQYTDAHEFGHLVGLPHIHCNTNSANCYGSTDRERANIMGLGNRVTRANYTPFIEAMRAITGSRWRAGR